MKYLRQFEIANTIARYRSVSKAAKELGLSQPTLSKYLQEIENELGVELFDRTVLPLRVTPACEKFIEAGRKIQNIDNLLRAELADMRENGNRVLRVGISPTRAPYILPDLIDRYCSLCREEKKKEAESANSANAAGERMDKIVIRERSISQLNAELIRGDLDLIISLQMEETKELASVPLFSETVLLAVPKAWHEISVETILREKPFISLGNGQQLWAVAKGFIAEAGGTEPMIECHNLELALSLVNKGLGATLVPSYMAKPHHERQHAHVAYLQIPETYCQRIGLKNERQICVFFRHDQFLTNAKLRFIEACRLMASGQA